jgi:hypothetical protein
LRLDTLDWQRISIGGAEYFRPRFNFSSTILGSKLILAGGIGHEYRILKDYQEVELD